MSSAVEAQGLSFSYGIVRSSWTREWTGVSCFARQILNHWATREAPFHINLNENITADRKGQVAGFGPSSQLIIISVLTFVDASSDDAGTSPKEAPCPPGKRESLWLPCWDFQSNAQMGPQLSSSTPVSSYPCTSAGHLKITNFFSLFQICIESSHVSLVIHISAVLCLWIIKFWSDN